MRNFFVVESLLLISVTLSLRAVGETKSTQTFNYPTQIILDWGRETVDKDLLKLYQTESVHPEKISSLNRKTFATFNSQSKITNSALSSFKGVQSINQRQAQSIHDAILSHPVVSPEHSARYDSPHRRIGYCFGRAAFVHWELLRRGVDPKSIAKVFAVGDLVHEGLSWEFHVATIVRARDGGWWAIDGYGDEPLHLSDWAHRVQSWSKNGAEHSGTRFYFADAAKFRAIPGRYSNARLMTPYYKGFFKDLLRWLNENPIRDGELFTQDE